MQKNFDSFALQEAMRLANSDVGQELMALLQKQYGQQLQDAMACAGKGDMGSAKEAIRKCMEDPAAQALLRRMQEEKHE